MMKKLLAVAFMAMFVAPALAADAAAAAALAAAEAAADAAAAAAAAAKAAVAAAKAALAAASAAPAQAAAPAQTATPAQAAAPVTTTGSAVAPQAYAKSSNNFEGPYVGLFADIKSTTFKVSGAVLGSSATFDAFGQQSVNGHVEAGYGLAVGEKMVLTAGATYDLASTTLFNFSGTNSNGAGASFNIKQKNQYSFFIAPGYKASEDTLVFAKLAYFHSNVGYSAVVAGGNTRPSSNQSNFGVNGFGYGLGIKTMLTKQTWLSVEAMRIDYSQLTVVSGANGTTGTTVGSMGLGYNFY